MENSGSSNQQQNPNMGFNTFQQPPHGGYSSVPIGNYQQPPQQQWGQPPQQQWGQPQFPGQQQFMPPPQQQQFRPAPPPALPPMPPSSNISGGAQDDDFFKGFYEGTVSARPSYFGSVMSWVGPLAVNLLIFVGPLLYMRHRFMQQMGAAAGKEAGKKGAAAGGSMFEAMMPLKPKKYRVEVKGTSFNDVIGIPEAKEELKQYVDFLANPEKFTRLGARLPKGCLLTGQPGTGKTLLARAVAGEADRPFLACSGADFIEIFGGSGPKRVRELFAEAKELAPCVVFIDEIDAIGKRGQGRSMGGGSSEENRTINQLLEQLDGLGSSDAIVVVAATNHADNIDKALTREGRFDRKVEIPMPDTEARNELFKFFLNRIVTGDKDSKPKIIKFKPRAEEGKAEEEKKADDAKKSDDASKATDEEEDAPPVIVEGVSNAAYAKELADRTPGISPAQVATIVNEAALACAVAEEKVVSKEALQSAIDDVLIGKKHRQRMGDASLRRTAYHECGHAMMAWKSPLQKDVIKVSIIPRGRAGGYTQQVQDEALDPKTNHFLFSQLCVLLGGRVAERLCCGDISTGAIDDLQRATKVAMDQLLSYGMSKEIGHLAFQPTDKSDGRAWFNYSEELHAKVEAEARALVNEAYDHTLKTLTENKELLVRMGDQLLEKKELNRGDIEPILGPRPKLVSDPASSKKLEDAAASKVEASAATA